jgi:hypothetical protein
MNEIIVSTESQVRTWYEVVDAADLAIYGGHDAGDAVYWLTRKSPAGSRLLVSKWDEDGEDAWLIGSPIDITSVVSTTLGKDY